MASTLNCLLMRGNPAAGVSSAWPCMVCLHSVSVPSGSSQTHPRSHSPQSPGPTAHHTCVPLGPSASPFPRLAQLLAPNSLFCTEPSGPTNPGPALTSALLRQQRAACFSQLSRDIQQVCLSPLRPPIPSPGPLNRHGVGLGPWSPSPP